MIKERPIIFSAPMVRAILEGRKKHTRRVINPRPLMVVDNTSVLWNGPSEELKIALERLGRGCPHGQPGDRLWVRETWSVPHAYDGLPPNLIQEHARLISKEYRIHYAATEERGGLLWRPSIHMPRWASRITLEITNIKVERLQDLSEEDAINEGIEPHADSSWKDYGQIDRGWRSFSSPVESFRTLWDSIYAKDPVKCWSANPWVWAIEFKKVNV
jgi:hypothetical protein